MRFWDSLSQTFFGEIQCMQGAKTGFVPLSQTYGAGTWDNKVTFQLEGEHANMILEAGNAGSARRHLTTAAHVISAGCPHHRRNAMWEFETQPDIHKPHE